MTNEKFEELVGIKQNMEYCNNIKKIFEACMGGEGRQPAALTAVINNGERGGLDIVASSPYIDREIVLMVLDVLNKRMEQFNKHFEEFTC